MNSLSYSPITRQLRETCHATVSPQVSASDLVSLESNAKSSLGTIIELPRIPDLRGNLTFVEGKKHVPFDIKRVFYLYDVPSGATRGGHAHKRLHQLMIAIAGSFDVFLDDGRKAEKFSLNRSYWGLHIPPMRWGELENFSSGAVCLVLASEDYDEADYFRQYESFLEALQI